MLTLICSIVASAALSLTELTHLPADTAAGADGGPAVIVHHQPTAEVVSIRMSVLAPDPPGFAGAGLLIQQLALPDLRRAVEPIGGRASIERTDEALAFTVTGPAWEMNALVAALREVLTPRAPDRIGRIRGVRAVDASQRGVWETAPSHVRARIRTSLFPDAPLVSGSPESIERLHEADTGALWAAMYRPERVLIVAAGNVRGAQLRAAFGDLPEPLSDSVPSLDDAVQPGASPQSTRAWVAVGHRLDTVEPAVLSVLARLLQDDLRSALPGTEPLVEHWWSRHGQALVMVVATSEARADEVRRQTTAALDRVSDAITGDPEVLRGAARTLWREMLLEGRSPEQVVAIAGRLAAVSGNPHEANRFHHALTAIRVQNVARTIEMLAEAPAARFHLPPQPLQQRP